MGARLYLALSCLQGRPMQSAFDELASLTGAVQLTPGNHPTPDFERYTTRQTAVATRGHHGFDFRQRRRVVWSDDARCVADASVLSVHPPENDSTAARAVREMGLGRWLEERAPRDLSLETMVPGYVLGNGVELELAMDVGVELAIDVSHVHIQREQGAMSARTWRRLQGYDRVGEVHVSESDGRRDLHAPLHADSFGLAWARERGTETALVLECYMHRLTRKERERQIALSRAEDS